MTESTFAKRDSNASVRTTLIDRFRDIRNHSTRIALCLYPEDCVIQSMPDASPIRWHLAHTTWFFETFVLKAFSDFRASNESFEFLFNSYYNSVGDQYPRERRGLLSRPTVDEVHAYRQETDDAIEKWLTTTELSAEQRHVFEIGLQHEQQHQELMLTDIKHLFSCNPLLPAMIEPDPVAKPDTEILHREIQRERKVESKTSWISFDEGIYEIGFDGDAFAYDNESPQHRVFLNDFSIKAQLTTNGEFLDFIEDGGYQRAEYWLSAGWSTVSTDQWEHPIYWMHIDNAWHEFTLGGLRPLDLDQPVSHVSYFEADAFARWAGRNGSGTRLATEAEWEVAASGATGLERGAETFFAHDHPVHSHGQLHRHENGIHDLFGSVWQWTSSQYEAYPGYQPPPGALGEYNGKFMCNQFVLRGSSCATSGDHARATYRNFFPPQARWQFTGIRLAK